MNSQPAPEDPSRSNQPMEAPVRPATTLTTTQKKRLIWSLAILAGSLLILGGAVDDSPSASSGSVSRRQMSKSDWISAAGGLANLGRIATDAASLYRAVGAPSSKQEVGNDTYLYWECADGMIQVAADRASLQLNGYVTGSVNTY